MAEIEPKPRMFDPATVGDSCGTGFVASINGVASHAIVESAVQALVNLTHRGAVNADPNTGDGAGVMIQLPYALLQERLAELDQPSVPEADLAVAVVFLPNTGGGEDADEARRLLEQAVDAAGLRSLGWRPVPVDPRGLGRWALTWQPKIEQFIIARPTGRSGSRQAIRRHRSRPEVIWCG